MLQQCEQLGDLAIVWAIPDSVFRMVPGTSEQHRACGEGQQARQPSGNNSAYHRSVKASMLRIE